jgi:alkylhydroperoxidase family enzyme
MKGPDMLRRLALILIAQQERLLGAPLDHLRHIAGTSLTALGKISLLAPLGGHRRALPADAFHVARLLATLHEDCGDCVQIEVNLARNDGVSPQIIRAVLDRQPRDLPVELNGVYRFTEAVLDRTGDDEWLRDQLRNIYGDEAVVELALAIATARFFPTTRRALGYAKSCSLEPVQVNPGLSLSVSRPQNQPNRFKQSCLAARRHPAPVA